VKVFGPLYVNMIRAGESSGALDSVLLRLAEFTEGQAKLRQKIVGTMIYPLIMMVIGGGVLIMLMTVVVPKVTKIFDDMKVTLPWTTRVLIFDVERAARLLVRDSSLADHRRPPSVSGRAAEKRSSRRGTSVVLKLPVFGPLVRMLSVARFARTLATLLKSACRC
jgi:general secretion pathway protein F